MKINIILLLFVALSFFACDDKNDSPQELSSSTPALQFGSGKESSKITIVSNTSWTVTGTTAWCSVDKNRGQKDAEITVTVLANAGEERSAQLLIKSSDKQVYVDITQNAKITENIQRDLPVIFHVLYNNGDDTLQNIKNYAIQRLVSVCNLIYSNGHNKSIDMGVRLKMATEDPKGNTLTETGINRVYYPNATNMNCETFMNSDAASDVKIQWDPNYYVNVFIYNFTDTNVLGISHLPYTPTSNSLPGLYPNNHYFTNAMKRIYCISLNSRYMYNTTDYALITLPHELGHYLGLFHVFSKDDCSETDHCDDTPNYNRQEYLSWLNSLPESELTWENAVKRTDCAGNSFISYNIMDYDYSWMQEFTPNQYARMQHVLQYSPLIPGSEGSKSITKGSEDDVIPPIIFMK